MIHHPTQNYVQTTSALQTEQETWVFLGVSDHSKASMKLNPCGCDHFLQAGGLTLSNDDLDQALGSAITAAILAPAGPQRSRLLSTLYKDERSARSPKYGFLEKVYLERILTGWVDSPCITPHSWSGTRQWVGSPLGQASKVSLLLLLLFVHAHWT